MTLQSDRPFGDRPDLGRTSWKRACPPRARPGGTICLHAAPHASAAPVRQRTPSQEGWWGGWCFAPCACKAILSTHPFEKVHCFLHRLPIVTLCLHTAPHARQRTPSLEVWWGGWRFAPKAILSTHPFEKVICFLHRLPFFRPACLGAPPTPLFCQKWRCLLSVLSSWGVACCTLSCTLVGARRAPDP
jgi:hypothetical protein